MRILITGGFGFLGGRLANHLTLAGHQIIIGTRHSASQAAWLPQADVIKIKWDDDVSLERSCKDVDVIIHSAGMNSFDCAADPLAALAFNGLATEKLVAAANRLNVKIFMYLSTAHVYSNPLTGIITEKSSLSNLHPYATSHVAGENAVLRVSANGKIQGIVLRLSNTFGAPTHKDVKCWKLLVNDLCKQAVQTRKLVLQTSGLQSRDFISLTDVCSIVEKLINQKELNQSNIFNVGAGISQSVLGMAQQIQKRCVEVLGYKPSLQFDEKLKHEKPLPLFYDTSSLNSLGINSKITNNTLEVDGLLKFCQFSFKPSGSSLDYESNN